MSDEEWRGAAQQKYHGQEKQHEIIHQEGDERATYYYSMAHLLITSIILGAVILMTIIGNVFVIAAIVLERNLRSVANYLIASLAVADLMVAALVMPLSAINEVTSTWLLGPAVCGVWISLDLLCCTSSILHLVAISIDRYWAVTRADYVRCRSAKRIGTMIALSWVISGVISITNHIGWGQRSDDDVGRSRATNNQTGSRNMALMDDWTMIDEVTAGMTPSIHRSHKYGEHDSSAVNIEIIPMTDNTIRGATTVSLSSAPQSVTTGAVECIISQDWWYTVFSTVGAFYMPLIFMMIIYIKIYRTASERIRKKRFTKTYRGAALVDDDDETSRRFSTRFSVVSSAMTAATAARCNDGEASTTANESGGDQDSIAAAAAANMPTAVIASSSRPSALPAKFLRQSSCASFSVRSMDDSASCCSTDAVGSPMTPTVKGGGLSSNGSWGWKRSHRGGISFSRVPRPVDLLLKEKTTGGTRSAEARAKEKREQKRERKAARTLAIITGSFVVCWLPFFIQALVRPFCGDRCYFPPTMMSVLLWLGYANSLLNPVIYTIFSPDFRLAFRKILFGKYSRGI